MISSLYAQKFRLLHFVPETIAKSDLFLKKFWTSSRKTFVITPLQNRTNRQVPGSNPNMGCFITFYSTNHSNFFPNIKINSILSKFSAIRGRRLWLFFACLRLQCFSKPHFFFEKSPRIHCDTPIRD